MSYSLKVEIAHTDLRHIRDKQYDLCLIKYFNFQDKNAPGNVVFANINAEDLQSENKFSWSEEHQTFMTDTFYAGVPVRVSTHSYDISQGMTANFDEMGSAQVGGIPSEMKPITVVNNWRDGGRVALTDFDLVTHKHVTAFISAHTPLKSANCLIPLPKVGLFFKREHPADTMVDLAQLSVFTVNFGDKKSVTARYKDGKWHTLDRSVTVG